MKHRDNCARTPLNPLHARRRRPHRRTAAVGIAAQRRRTTQRGRYCAPPTAPPARPACSVPWRTVPRRASRANQRRLARAPAAEGEASELAARALRVARRCLRRAAAATLCGGAHRWRCRRCTWAAPLCPSAPADRQECARDPSAAGTCAPLRCATAALHRGPPRDASGMRARGFASTSTALNYAASPVRGSSEWR